MPLDNKSLTVEQFKEIINLIWDKHRFGGLSKNKDNTCKHIKYVRPNFDMRDGCIFNVKFDDKMFDFRDDERPMYERIMEWLNTENKY